MFDNFTFVLVRPKKAENVGAAARALKNMGFSHLRLVAPANFDRRIARTLSVHASDLVDKAEIYYDLPSAIADHTLTVGTTCRKGSYRAHARDSRALAEELARAASLNKIAIIFGPEDNGLNNHELESCQQLMVVPTASAYPSLNLAHAVAIIAYDLRMALMALNACHEESNANNEPSAEKPVFARATAGAVEMMFQRLEELLVEIGFLPAENPQRIMLALRAMFGRAGLSQRELDILNGIISQVKWFVEGGHQVIESKRRMGVKIR